MSDVNRIRILPFLTYARALSNQFQFLEAENVYLEVLELFPKKSIGYIEYGKFLYQFKKRTGESLKIMMKGLQCGDINFENLNNICTLIVNNKKLLSGTLKNIMKINTENMIKNFGFYFKMDSKNIFNTRLEYKGNETIQFKSHHLLECSYIYFLCARFSGLYLDFPFGTIMSYYYAFIIQVSTFYLF